jgi:hypothetical protein
MRVRIEALDVAGRRVSELLDGRLGPGGRDLTWDLRDQVGHPLESGIYFVRVKTDGGRENQFVRRVVVMH